MTEESSGPYLAAVKAEHQELGQLVHAVEAAFAAAAEHGWKGERTLQVAEQLAALRDFVRDHFAQDEDGGCLEEALSHTPRLGPEAARLERQHPQLIAKISDVCDRALKQHDNHLAWPTIQENAHEALKELLNHEAGENQILLQAFNVDVGLTD